MLELICYKIPLPILNSIIEKLNSLVERLDRIEDFCRWHEVRREMHGGFVAYVKYHMENPDHE